MIQILQGFLSVIDSIEDTTVNFTGGENGVSLAMLCFGLPIIGAILALAAPWTRGGDDDD